MHDDSIGRRGWIKLVGGAAGAGAALAVARQAGAAPPAAGKGMQAIPWPYAPLDPDATAERAFKGYLEGHCMYGAFDALAGQVADKLGAPYTSFPTKLFTYGAGGVAGWATLCGALNGAAAAFQLLSAKPEPLVDALFRQYEQASLPDWVPASAKFPNVKSVAGSVLCHASVSAWCKASGKKAYSPERKERCGVLTASVARHAAIILNAQHAGKAFPVLEDKATAECASCHEKGGTLENTRAKMACGGCHFNLGTKHPAI
ncbi:split soret cytochrome c precursor [Anaeromyxobacter sp. K]|uniref:C-GCAxxG-C-C family protein n=1 Tax=Anaeromyxobacter sp. (strain K) TaxID=447217 RepID=UPI00015F9C3F|nr:C-GCAxxG-C-C family protein [Anaeromyxobacter sp. K]ACG71571.1 split soret cytochrome c precursor [Anaeromyxobacter sp. K]